MSDLAIHAELQERVDKVAVDALYAAREGDQVMDEAAKLVGAAVLAEAIPALREKQSVELREPVVEAVEKMAAPLGRARCRAEDAEDVDQERDLGLVRDGMTILRSALAASRPPDPAAMSTSDGLGA